jgi:nitrilase
MAMYSKGVDNCLALTTDARDSWQMTLRHIDCEGRWGCNQFVIKSIYPLDLESIEDLDNQPEIMCRGGTAIIPPLGRILAVNSSQEVTVTFEMHKP